MRFHAGRCPSILVTDWKGANYGGAKGKGYAQTCGDYFGWKWQMGKKEGNAQELWTCPRG